MTSLLRSCWLFALLSLCVVTQDGNAQTASTYWGYSVGSGQIAAYSVINGQMNGASQFTHTYNVGVQLLDPFYNSVSSGTKTMSMNAAQYATERADVSMPFSWDGFYEVVDVASASCSEVGPFYYSNTTNQANELTPVQHSYPRSPFSKACYISSWFDAVRTVSGAKSAHHAEDVIFDIGSGGPQTPTYGTPVYAMEAGKVLTVVSSAGPASGYPNCGGAAGNYVKIQTTGDPYYTVYFHITPSVKAGASVAAGQEIGVLDNSGCQSGPHVHVGRKDAPGHPPVNFSIPCTNKFPGSQFDLGTPMDNDSDSLY